MEEEAETFSNIIRDFLKNHFDIEFINAAVYQDLWLPDVTANITLVITENSQTERSKGEKKPPQKW